MRRTADLLLLLLWAGAAAFGWRALDRPPAVPARSVDRFEYYFIEPFQPFFVNALDGVSMIERRPLAAPAQKFARKKPRGVFRVFMVGGSPAQLYGARDGPAGLGRALRARLPGRGVEVINCGRPGYDSSREARVVEEIMDYAPDLLVLMSVVNEEQPELPSRWAVQAMRLQRRSAWDLSLPGPLPRQRLAGRTAKFEANLGRMAALARRAGVPLLVCTMPMNLRHLPARGSLPLGRPSFLEAWLEWESGSWAAAAAAFRREAARFPNDPMAAYWLARALDRRGRVAEAADAFRAAAALSGRDIPALNSALRRLAGAQRLPLADLEAAFARVSPQGILGRNLMEDDVHWFRSADVLVTAEILESLEASGILPAARLVGRRPAGNGSDALESGPPQAEAWPMFRYRMWEELPRAALFNERLLAVLETVAEADPGLLAAGSLRGRLKRELEENIWDKDGARRVDALWPTLMAHIGEIHRRSGRFAAAEKSFASVAGGRDWPRLRLWRAVSSLQAGRPAGARRKLDGTAWESDPVAQRIWQGYLRRFKRGGES